MFQFFRDSWKRLGLDVEITATDYNAFQDKVRTGAYQLFWWGWVRRLPGPGELPLPALRPDGAHAQRRAEHRQLRRPALRRAASSRMRARENDPERAALIAEMRAILERERPWIEIFHPEDYTLQPAAGCGT